MKGFFKFFGNKAEKKKKVEFIEKKLLKINQMEQNFEYSSLERIKEQTEIIFEEYNLLKEILKVNPNIVNNSLYVKIYNSVKEIVEHYDKLIVEIENIKQTEELLKKEILSYSKTAKELGQKYKLSPDWEGYKPKMAEYGKILNKKRDDYIKNEESAISNAKSFCEKARLANNFFFDNINKIIWKNRYTWHSRYSG